MSTTLLADQIRFEILEVSFFKTSTLRMLLVSLILLFLSYVALFFLFYQIVPYFGVMFSTFEFCKRVCLYRNGYIESPLNYKLTPGVDQSLQPQELRELKLLRRENFESRKSALEN